MADSYVLEEFQARVQRLVRDAEEVEILNDEVPDDIGPHGGVCLLVARWFFYTRARTLSLFLSRSLPDSQQRHPNWMSCAPSGHVALLVPILGGGYTDFHGSKSTSQAGLGEEVGAGEVAVRHLSK